MKQFIQKLSADDIIILILIVIPVAAVLKFFFCAAIGDFLKFIFQK